MKVKNEVIIENIMELGEEVKWYRCNILSKKENEEDEIDKRGVNVYEWKGEKDEEYIWWIEKKLVLNDGKKIKMIMDEGGDLKNLINKKYKK